MRNIKSTLRIMRNSALLFVAASGAAYLTGCSSDIDSPNSGGNSVDENVTVESLGVTAGNNPSLAKTYSNSHQIGTRAYATFDVPEHPGMPSTPEEEELLNMYVLPKDYDGQWIKFELPANTEKKDFNPMSILEQYNVRNDSIDVHVVDASNITSLPETLVIDFHHAWDSSNPVDWAVQANLKATYYIDGAVTATGVGNGHQKLHILRGGQLTSNTEFDYNNTVYLHKGGKLLSSKNDQAEIYLKCTVIAEEDITTDKNIIIDSGKVYTYGKIQGNEVSTINTAKLYAGCSVIADKKIYLTNSSEICAGYTSAPTIKLDSNAKISLRNGAYVNATKQLDLENCGDVRVSAEEGELAMISTDELFINLIDVRESFRNVAIKFNSASGDNRVGADGSGILWNETDVYVDGKDGNGNVLYEVVEDKKDTCAPIRVVKPGEDDTVDDPENSTDPKLEIIGSVAPSDGIDHTHPISATCVSTYGNNAYLSWHTQGENFHGCIEYLTVANGTATLNGYLETAPSENEYAIDFNHVIFDDGKIFVAGDHPKKGGILGWIYCNDANGFVTGQANLYMRALYEQKYEKEGEDPKYANSGSGNCIIRNGNYYQVASIKGFETFNVGDFASEKYIVTDENGVMKFAAPKSIARLGSWTFDSSISADPTTYDSPRDGTRTGKHIATDGSKVVMLTLINRNNTSKTATASIKVYAASDVTYENCLASYEVTDAVLSPVDGKDVIAIKGEDIWVCLGNGGVQHLKLSGNSISKVSEFVLKAQPQETLKNWGMSQKEADSYCANGLAVDDKYVYVAHGGAGLIVLNKEDLTFVTRTRYNGGKSANYVKLSSETFSTDQYIYVAYGMSNLQIFAWRRSNN